MEAILLPELHPTEYYGGHPMKAQQREYSNWYNFVVGIRCRVFTTPSTLGTTPSTLGTTPSTLGTTPSTLGTTP